MPRHIRNNLLNGLQTVLDRAWEFQELERLTPEEKKDVVGVRGELMLLKHRFGAIIEILEERGDYKIPERITGPAFSWVAHDEKVIARRPARKRRFTPTEAELLAKLANLEAKLKELQNESSG
jgi:hypothetical protein